MKRIEFSVTYPDELVHPLHRRIQSGTTVTRAELLMWSPTAEATTLLWCDGDRAAAERAIGALDSLVASAVVEDTDGTYVFLRQAEYEFAGAILDAVADASVIFLPPVVFLETGAVRFEAVGETEALGTLHGALSDLGDVDIRGAREFERGDAPGHLTDRQRAALETAVAVGYYEVPREGTVADVAAELDCAASTAGELIRKAEAAVIRHYTQAQRAGGVTGHGSAQGPR
jgi:hypothetical protein